MEKIDRNDVEVGGAGDDAAILPRKYWKYFAMGLVLVYALFVVALGELPDRQMHLWFLDVGQGDAVLVQTPEGHNVLIDGGPKSKVLEELTDVLPFFNQQIDLMVLTHPHSDHIEGLVEVLKRYEVGAVLITGVAYDNHYYEEFLRDLSALVDSGVVDLYVAEAKMDFRVGSAVFDVLYPIESLAGREIDNLNNSSVVMRLSYPSASDGGASGGVRRVLLTGDCEIECEEEILAAGFDVRAEILKAGHHGSKTASSPEFVEAVGPSVAVIQVGEGNTFRHPHAETLRTFYRLGIRKIWRSDLDGRIRLF